jgi:hypothetical protein
MPLPRRSLLIVYLALWSTLAARFSFELVYLVIPRRGDLAAIAQVVPFVAFPASLGLAFLMLRRTRRVAAALGCYLWMAPVLLYLLLLLVAAAMAAASMPLAAIFVLVLGALFGLPALLVGIPLHAIGIFPLRCFEDRFWADPLSAQPPDPARRATANDAAPAP